MEHISQKTWLVVFMMLAATAHMCQARYNWDDDDENSRDYAVDRRFEGSGDGGSGSGDGGSGSDGYGSGGYGSGSVGYGSDGYGSGGYGSGSGGYGSGSGGYGSGSGGYGSGNSRRRHLLHLLRRLEKY